MKLRLTFRLMVILLIVIFCKSAFGGIAIKINSASVDVSNEMLQLRGINFNAFGPVSVTIGDTLLADCTVDATAIQCPLAGTPDLSGASWNVSISAGNSPHSNDDIDVYVPTELLYQGCNVGDFVECYSGDPATMNVGICMSGIRTCLTGGTWSECVGEILPEEEICGDLSDNDCNGEVDEGLGQGELCPASSCEEIHTYCPSCPNGLYWVDFGSGPEIVFCDFLSY